VIGTPLDNRDVDLRQRQLSRQHHPRRTSSGDHHSMLGHRHTPAGVTPLATSASHPSAPSARNCTANRTIGSTSPRDRYVDKNTRISLLPFR
jgi:hypothetical protein